MPAIAAHIWRPSSARVIVLDGFGPVPRGTAQTVPPLLAWPAKDPADVLDYQLDVAAALSGDDEDGIAGLEVQVNPSDAGGLQLVSSYADGTRAVLWLSGGNPGTTYTVILVIGTKGGRTLARAVQLPVLTLSAPVLSPGTIVTESGSAVTDQNGNPLVLGG